MTHFSHQAVTMACDIDRIDSGKISCPSLPEEDDSLDWRAAPA
jgi:hypothetical protein